MANFNEKINSHVAFVLRDSEHNYFIQRSDSMEEFERLIDHDLFYRKNAYRMCIQYKDTHPVKKVAGNCFVWDYASATSNHVEVRSLNCDSNEDFSYFGYFGDPVFDSIEGAIFITDKYVVTYGDTWIDAAVLKKEYVVCDAFVCGRLVSTFKIPAETFDRLFGLKENFLIQYEDVFGNTDDAKPVQEETLENEKIYDAYEIACLMDSNRLCSDLVSSLIRLIGGANSHYVSKDIYEKSQVARKAVEDLAIELGISICNIENGRQ